MKTPDYIVTYEDTPEYLTTGKRYVPEEDFCDDAELLSIYDDAGGGIIVLTPGCAHLGGRKWKRGYIFHV